MIRSMTTHTARILKTGASICTFGILFGLVLYNFVIQTINNSLIGEASQMYDPVYTSILSNWSFGSNMDVEGQRQSLATQFLFIIYPVLVAFPITSLWISDRGSGMVNYFDQRSGRTAFWFGKLAAVFIATFIIFTIPFLLEVLLGVLCFPASAQGLPGMDYLQQPMLEEGYFWAGLWGKNRILYAVVMILLFGIVSGVFGVFAYAFSTLPFMHFRVLNFLPVFILLYGGIMAGAAFKLSIQLNYMYIMRLFHVDPNHPVRPGLYVGILAFLLLISAGIVFVRSRKDQLS